VSLGGGELAAVRCFHRSIFYHQCCATVEYLLEHLEQLAAVTAQATQSGGLVLSEPNEAGILQEARQEADKIRSGLVTHVFQFTKEKEIELFIRNYQEALTHLLDHLYRQQQGLAQPSPAHVEFYESFYQPILGLLSFMECRFSPYFGKNEPVPAIYLALTQEEIKGKLSRLSVLLSSRGEDLALTQKIITAFNVFVENPVPGTVTYRDIIYRKELIRELQDIDRWPVQLHLFSGLTQLLIYLNYNDKEYINDVVNGFARELNGLEDANDKIDRLLLYSKTLNQLPCKPDTALHGKHPSVKTQLNNWMAEELYYQEKKLGQVKGALSVGTSPVPGTKLKVVCKASVDQLGVFFRAAADIELITTLSQRALFEQITPFLSTPHKKVLSADSMRSKSYSPEKKDVEAVKDLLMQLYKKITQY